MRKRTDKKKDLKDRDIKDDALGDGVLPEDNADGSPGASENADDRYAYDEGEFDPDKWENKPVTGKKKFFQNGMGLFVCVIALILFAALFIVEFRSYTQIRKGDSGYVNPDKKDDTAVKPNTILEIIETGSNYTIYLDTDTGIEYVMFRVGSSISIQPLINPDGSYKQYVEPPTTVSGVSEAATKHNWLDNFKLPGADKEKVTEPPTKARETRPAQPGTADQKTTAASAEVKQP